MPSATPFRWRRTTQAMKPMIASVVISMSSGAVSGKYMSDHESKLPPCGSRPYFMSVMKAWLSRNGPVHHIDEQERR